MTSELVNIPSTSSSALKNNEEIFWDEIGDDSVLNQLLDEPFDFEETMGNPSNCNSLRQDNDYKGFDDANGKYWVYPINFPIRQYQYNITKAALFTNTLVVLPTGLGKTFIAAVVMYNIMRWYPTAKIIFMAPTRPLVSQQIEACQKIMGIPLKEMAEMTGKQGKAQRTGLWQTKKIFFATPQVVQSDIYDTEQNFPFQMIKLIVVDEAHKARGRYAYTDVVRQIHSRNKNFRILALSATPGRKLDDVREVVENLFIGKVEVRCENSIDVAPYTHKKNIKVVIIPLGEDLTEIRNEFIEIIDPYVRNLMKYNFLNSASGNNLSKGWIVMEQKRFRAMSECQRHPQHSEIATNFSTCISLYHALELLERHGFRVFIKFFDESEENAKNFYVKTNRRLEEFLKKLREKIGPNPFEISDQTMPNGKIAEVPANLDFGHPKFSMIKQFLKEHFEENHDSRVIIFCEYRESVMLIHRLLLQSRPLIKPRIFVGQGGNGSIRAVTQKQQLQIMNDFRQNVSNTLICTCVAEEGLDIGEVDMIICFDISTKSPIRLIQRMGRTGRQRDGKVIMMATEGKEQSIVKEVLSTKDKINNRLSNSREINNCLYRYSPRLIPNELNPKCLEIYIKLDIGNKDDTKENVLKLEANKNDEKKIRNKKLGTKKKKLLPKDPETFQDMRNFFKKIELDQEDQENFVCTPQNTQQKNKEIKRITNDFFQIENVVEDFVVSQINHEKKKNIQTAEKNLANLEKQAEDISLPSVRRSTLITESSENLDFMFKKLTHLTRNLNKLGLETQDYRDVFEVLKSKTVDVGLKKFILANNVSFVRKNFNEMKILWALEDNTDADVMVIEDTEKKIRNIYAMIEKVFGGKTEIDLLIQQCDQMKNEQDILRIFEEKYGKFFDQFEESNDKSYGADGFIKQQLEGYSLKDFEFNSDDENEAMKVAQEPIPKPILDDEFEDFCTKTESKYAYQFEDNLLNLNKEMNDDDDSVQSANDEVFQMATESTPIASKKFGIRNFNKDLNESPLAPNDLFQDNKKKNGFKSIFESKTLEPLKAKSLKDSISLMAKCLSPLAANVTQISSSKVVGEIEILKEIQPKTKSEMIENYEKKNNINGSDFEKSKNNFEWFVDPKLAKASSQNNNSKLDYIDNFEKLEYENLSNCFHEDVNDVNLICPSILEEENPIASVEVKTNNNSTIFKNINNTSGNHNNVFNNKSLETKLNVFKKSNKIRHTEISADLFDDDFDDFFLDSENILNNLEKELSSKKNSKTEKATYNKEKAFFTPTKNSSDAQEPLSIKANLESQHEYENENKRMDNQKINETLIEYSSEHENDDVLSQSLEKLNKSIQSSNIFNKSSNMILVDDVLKLVENIEKVNKDEPKENKHLFGKIESQYSNPSSQKENSVPREKNNLNEISLENPNVTFNVDRQISDDIFDVSSIKPAKTPPHHSLLASNFGKKNDNEISPSVVGRKRLHLSKFKNDNSNTINEQQNLETTTYNDSLVFRKKSSVRKRVIESDSDSDNNNASVDDGDDAIPNSQVIGATPTRGKRWIPRWNERRKKRKRHCSFLDDEANHSGKESDEDDNTGLSSLITDSIIVSDNEVEDHPDVNMRAKYLESIRSPKRMGFGVFKIPSPRNWKDLSKICSQPFAQESMSAYKEDSFVVSDEERIQDNEIIELDELELAEAKLKERRRSKRLCKQKNSPKRKRILNRIIELSDDES